MENSENSIHELLEIFKQMKNSSDNKNKDLSAISFSNRNYDSSNRNPFDSISISHLQNMSNHSKLFGKAHNVFEKLYNEKKELDKRRNLLEYETRRSKEEKERSECTFSPNIRSRKLVTQYESVERNSEFYDKNIKWQENKDKSIKKLQCQKNQENSHQYTFTPKIVNSQIIENKNKYKKKTDEEVDNSKITCNKGVSDFLQRQQKAKKNLEYIKEKQNHPYMHVWNMKKGQFSYIK